MTTTVQPPNSQREGEGNAVPPSSFSSAIIRGIMMYMFMNMVQKFAMQQGYFPTPPIVPSSVATPSTTVAVTSVHDDPTNTNDIGKVTKSVPHRVSLKRPSCVWKPHTMLDLHVFVTDTEESLLSDSDEEFNLNCLDIPDRIESSSSEYTLLAEWHQNDLTLDSKDASINYRNDTLSIAIPHSVQFNQTHIYAHVCLMPRDDVQNSNTGAEDDDGQQPNNFLYKTIALTKYKKRKRIRDEKSLLSSSDIANVNANTNATTDDSSANENDISLSASPLTQASANRSMDTTLLYLKPSLTLQIVDMNGMPALSDRNKVPGPILQHMDWLNSTSAQYFPILHSSEFWIRQNSLVELNDTISFSTIEVKVEQVKLWKWQVMSQMEETWEKQSAASGGEEDGGTDMFRTMLLDTNPILLAVTGVISVLHTLFDMLAFKNDVKFFKNKKSMEGLSIRSMVVNVFFQLVILLYLMDNETSYMVVCSNALGVAIEMWKISRAVNVSIFDHDWKFRFRWKESDTYKTSKTKEYDEIATDHLKFLMMPLVFGYGVYSLCHQKHRGWYSYLLNTLVGFIYMFGFVNMTPQLFINYKLQSVAHLNWRTMTYKSINTFIDDLFGEFNWVYIPFKDVLRVAMQTFCFSW